MHRFPVGFWNYPSIDSMEVSEVKLWADCGMTVTMSPTLPIREDAIKKLQAMLDECTKYGLRLIIRDPRLSWDGAADDPEGYREKFRVSMREFGHHPATYGFFVGDEPSTEKQFRDCKCALRIQKEEAPHLVGFLNFLPYWPGMEKDIFGGKEFSVWAKEFTQDSDCQMMSYDCYTQLNPEEEGVDRYFLNLNKFMKASKSAGIPLWTTLLSVGHFRYRVPTEDDLRWQFNTAVASGCKGIHWFFFYGQNFRNYRGAPISPYGEKTIAYDWMKLLHRTFHDNHASLMSALTHKETYHTHKAYGEYELFHENAHAYIKTMESQHNVPGIISFFEDENGKEYIAIVNNSPFESDLFTLSISKQVSRVFLIHQNGEYEEDMRISHHDAIFEETDSSIRAGVYLAPGQMEIFRLEV